MSTALEELKVKALELSPSDRSELIRALIASIDGETEDTPDAIAQAWDEEIAYRVVQLEAGAVQTIPHEEVMARLRAKFG